MTDDHWWNLALGLMCAAVVFGGWFVALVLRDRKQDRHRIQNGQEVQAAWETEYIQKDWENILNENRADMESPDRVTVRPTDLEPD